MRREESDLLIVLRARESRVHGEAGGRSQRFQVPNRLHSEGEAR